MLLIFSNVEITPQPFTQEKNISYKESFDKILFENKVLHPNTGEMKLA